MSEVYRLQNTYDYILPKAPPLAQMLYADKPLKEQYWKREEFDWKKMNKQWTDRQKHDFVKRELARRKHGIWIVVFGVPTYLTGSNYYFLQYFIVPIPEEEGKDFTSEEYLATTKLIWSFAGEGMMYPQYRNYQREFFYFLDHVAKTSYCEGAAIAKPRRVGITACFNADCLNKATTLFKKNFSLMNKDFTDALEVNYDPIKLNISKWPSLTLSDGSEIWRPKIPKLLTKRAKFEDTQDSTKGLNSLIYVNTTVENANDGTGTFRLIRDEFSKYPADIDIANMLFILRPVAKVGTRQVGKIFLFGTSAEKDTKNFERWKIIYWDSDITLYGAGNKTGSGLFKYFISGKYAIEGDVQDMDGNTVELFDRYGHCKEDLAIQWIYSNMKPYLDKGDTASLQAVKRQYPIDENDPFDSVTDSSCYDTIRLAAQLQNIEQKHKLFLAGVGKPLYVRGRLEWVTIDKEVQFIHMKENDPPQKNNWIVFRLPHENWRNKIYTDRFKFINPDDNSPYFWLADPIDYRNFLAQGSKAAIGIGSALDSLLEHGGETWDARYLYRPANPNEVIENVRMAAIFWAAKGVPEINKAWLATDLIKGRDDNDNKRPNYGRFMLTYDKIIKGYRQWRYTDKDIAGIFTGTGSVEGYLRDTNVFLKEPQSDKDRDHLIHIDDAELLTQWKRFDPMNTTKFDLAMIGSLYAQVLKNYNRNTSRKPTMLTDSILMQAWYNKIPATNNNQSPIQWDKTGKIPIAK